VVVRRTCTCDDDLSDRSDLHLSELERVVVTVPLIPVDSVSVTGVRTAEVETVEIRPMARFIPPAAFVELSTVIGKNVVVVVKR